VEDPSFPGVFEGSIPVRVSAVTGEHTRTRFEISHPDPCLLEGGRRKRKKKKEERRRRCGRQKRSSLSPGSSSSSGSFGPSSNIWCDILLSLKCLQAGRGGI